MASVNFTLRKHTKGATAGKIQADVVFNGHRVQKSIGHACDLKEWSADKGRVKLSGKRANVINTLLNKIERDLLDYFILCQGTKQIPDKDKVNQIIIGIDYKKDSTLIDDQITLFIEETKTGNRTTPRGKEISEITQKGYVYWSQNFKDFLKFCGVKKMHEITESFLSEWQKWQAKEIGTPANKELGLPASSDYKQAYADNSITTAAQIFNAFATFYEKSGKDKLPRARKWRHAVDMVIIYPEEVKALLEWHPENETIRYVRDIFCVSVMTCLRVSNLKLLRKQNVISNANGLSLSFVIKKGGKPHTIKLTKIAAIIISERLNEDGDLIFPGMCTAHYNNNLKKMALLFGNHLKKIGLRTSNDWLGSVPKTTYHLGQPHTEYVPFWKMISSHTGRRSGITGLSVKGYGVEMIRGVSGHAKGSTSIYTYINISQQHTDRMLEQAWD